MPLIRAAVLQMPPVNTGLAVAAGVVVLLLLFVYGLVRRYVPTYNTFVELEEDVEKARSDIDALLQRREDELNRLFVAVREATGHESTTLSEVVDARRAVEAGESGGDTDAANPQALRALTQFDARAEEYPEINAVGNIETLQENIVKIEEELAEQREAYNQQVTEYNKKVRKFPGSVIARLGGFEPRDQFTPTAEVLAGDQFGIGSAMESSGSATESGEPEELIEDAAHEQALEASEPADGSDGR